GGVQYHVDTQGSDTNDGKSWAKAVATIQKGIDLSNAYIDALYDTSGPGEAKNETPYNTIWIRPGVYAENIVRTPYFCHLIGLGIHGTDTQVEIHPAAGSCFAGIFRAVHLANLWMEGSEAAAPIIDLTVANMSIIEHCKFLPTIAGVTGIRTANSGWLTIRYCDFETGGVNLEYGIHCEVGFFNNARIHDNAIFADNTGIAFEMPVNAHQTVIKDNVIDATTKGVYDNGGMSFLINNWIHAANAIDHADAKKCIANHVINVAAGAVETAGTD
ncbi:unnamed protein product, partial [marine sediment metagenome]